VEDFTEFEQRAAYFDGDPCQTPMHRAVAPFAGAGVIDARSEDLRLARAAFGLDHRRTAWRNVESAVLGNGLVEISVGAPDGPLVNEHEPERGCPARSPTTPMPYAAAA
jgi:hypothetical protein